MDIKHLKKLYASSSGPKFVMSPEIPRHQNPLLYYGSLQHENNHVRSDSGESFINTFIFLSNIKSIFLVPFDIEHTAIVLNFA